MAWSPQPWFWKFCFLFFDFPDAFFVFSSGGLWFFCLFDLSLGFLLLESLSLVVWLQDGNTRGGPITALPSDTHISDLNLVMKKAQKAKNQGENQKKQKKTLQMKKTKKHLEKAKKPKKNNISRTMAWSPQPWSWKFWFFCFFAFSQCFFAFSSGGLWFVCFFWFFPWFFAFWNRFHLLYGCRMVIFGEVPSPPLAVMGPSHFLARARSLNFFETLDHRRWRWWGLPIFWLALVASKSRTIEKLLFFNKNSRKGDCLKKNSRKGCNV